MRIKNLSDKWFQKDGVWYKQRNSKVKLRGTVKVCGICNEEYLVTNADASIQKFCSIECGVIGKRKFKLENDLVDYEGLISTPQNPINLNETWVYESASWWKIFKSGIRTKAYLKNCHQCKEYFLSLPATKKRFCSKKCSGAHTAALSVEKKKIEFGNRSGENCHMWKGGRNIIRGGYVEIYCPNHPFARGGKYVREHRLIMENYLGRYLERWEVVHHINGIKDDNRIENLELCIIDSLLPGGKVLLKKRHVPGQRYDEAKKHCPTCTCGCE